MTSRKGFEPLTYGLGNRCSILLSYRDNPVSDEPLCAFIHAAHKHVRPAILVRWREEQRTLYPNQRLVSR